MNGSIQMTSRKTRNTGGLAASPMKVDVNMVQEYFDALRGTGPDLFKVVKFDKKGECVELQKGWIPHGDEDDNPDKIVSLLDRQNSLDEFVRNYSGEAIDGISNVSDYFDAEDKERCFFATFVPCTKGVIAVAWAAEDGDIEKAKMMASFTLYALGLKYILSDKVLGQACYRHLPFRAKIERQLADDLFAKYVIIDASKR